MNFQNSTKYNFKKPINQKGPAVLTAIGPSSLPTCTCSWLQILNTIFLQKKTNLPHILFLLPVVLIKYMVNTSNVFTVEKNGSCQRQRTDKQIKITKIGNMDPYKVLKKDWTLDPNTLSPFTFSHLHGYFVCGSLF